MNSRITNLNGFEGAVVIDDTNATPAPAGKQFSTLLVMAEAVVTTAVGNVTNMDGQTLPVGLMLPGRWSSITLGSGVVAAYYDRS